MGREVKNAIIDIMILMDKEAENSEKTEEAHWQVPIIMLY